MFIAIILLIGVVTTDYQENHAIKMEPFICATSSYCG